MSMVCSQPVTLESVDEALIERLLELPSKILTHHDVHGLEQIVLHDLSHGNNFGFSKATYLIDNPDFDCLKGVAGFCQDECCHHQEDVWTRPDSFMHDMHHATFHRDMNNFLHHGLRDKEKHVHNEDDVKELGLKLGLKNPSCLIWNMRHGNHGILVFEDGNHHLERRATWLKHFATLLSLC